MSSSDPADVESQSLGKGIIDLEETREDVVREVFNAPKRRVDNEISRLSDNIAILQMHCLVVTDLLSIYRKAVWKARLTSTGAVLGAASAAGGAFYMEAPMQIFAGTSSVAALAAVSVLWWNNSSLLDLSARLVNTENVEKSFKKKFHRQLAGKFKFIPS